MNLLTKLILLFVFTVGLLANEKISLQLLWKHQFEFAGFYIAKEKGFYKELGLEVAIKEYEFGINIVDDVLNSRSDIGIGRSSLVVDKLNGAEIVLLNALYQNSPFMLISKKRNDLKTVKDFKSKKIMLSDDLSSIAAISSMMQRNNIRKEDYTEVPHSFNIKDLMNDKVDLMTTYISNEPYELEKHAVAYTLFNPKEYGFDFYADLLFTSENYLKKNEENVQKFQEATLKGWEYAFNNIDETVNLILNKYNTQNKTKEAYIYEANVLKSLAYKQGIPFGSINPKKIQEIANIYKILGITNKDSKVLEHFIYKKESILQKIFSLKLFFLILTIATLFILLTLYKQYILKKQYLVLEAAVKNKTQDLQKHAQKLEKQKELYDLVFENSSDGVMFIDIESSKVIDCNQQTVTMFQANSKEEVINKHPSKLSPEYQAEGLKSVDHANKKLEETIKNGSNNFLWKHLKADGTEFWVEVNLTKITLDNKDIIYVTWKDVDEKIKAEEELKFINEHLEETVEARTLELKHALRVKSDFLANMSHEIRTPLNAIIGFIDILYKNEDQEEKLQQLKTIKESSHSLVNIINDILDFSKIENGKLILEQVPIYTAKPFTHTVELFFDKAQEKDINITLNIDAAIPKKTLGDSTRIKQIFSNLLSNAIKFSHENTTIIVNISYDTQMHKLYCEIIDTGIGIPKEKLSNIFNSFEQADSSVTRTHGGTGLGLAISKSLVEYMGGEIGVTSEPDKGSKFYFTLELHEVQDKIEEKAVAEETPQLQGKVLMVEDNKTNQLLLSMILDDLNLEYDIANDGVEAVEIVQKETYDIILMDENMPNMNGIEATSIIRSMDRFSNLPIIAVTANALKGDRERFLEAGMDEYITKPIDIDELISILSNYLNK